jgi:hypothetical protein
MRKSTGHRAKVGTRASDFSLEFIRNVGNVSNFLTTS